MDGLGTPPLFTSAGLVTTLRGFRHVGLVLGGSEHRRAGRLAVFLMSCFRVINLRFGLPQSWLRPGFSLRISTLPCLSARLRFGSFRLGMCFLSLGSVGAPSAFAGAAVAFAAALILSACELLVRVDLLEIRSLLLRCATQPRCCAARLLNLFDRTLAERVGRHRAARPSIRLRRES